MLEILRVLKERSNRRENGKTSMLAVYSDDCWTDCMCRCVLWSAHQYFSLIIFIDRPKEPATQAYVCDLMSQAILLSPFRLIYTVEPILGIQNIHTSNSIEYFGKTRSHTLAHTAHVLSAHASISRKKRIKEIHFRRIVIDVLFVSFIPSPFQSYTPFTHQVLFTLAWWRLSHYLYAWKLTNNSECRISAAMLLAVT